MTNVLESSQHLNWFRLIEKFVFDSAARQVMALPDEEALDMTVETYGGKDL